VKVGSSRQPRGTWTIFAVPLLLAVLTLLGLVVGLTGEGVRDLIAWLLLTPVPGVLVWAWFRRR
jgi:hypothetical protein